MRLFIIPILVSLTGCASDALRPTAAATMSMTQGLKAAMTTFAARQNAEIDASRRALVTERQQAKLSSFRGAKERMDWRGGDNEEALQMFDEATKPGIGPGLVGLLGEDPASMHASSAVQIEAKQYDVLLKALKPLTQKASPLADAQALLKFGEAVVDQMKEDVEAPADEEAAAGGEADPGTSESEDGE